MSMRNGDRAVTSEEFSYISGYAAVVSEEKEHTLCEQLKYKVSGWEPLQIGKSGPLFFVENVAQSSEFYVQQGGRSKRILAMYFTDNPKFRRLVLFDLLEGGQIGYESNEYGPPTKLIGVHKALEGGTLDQRLSSHADNLTRTVSQHIRGSYSLTEGIAFGSDMTIYPDRGGLGIITERDAKGGLEQILRAFLCQGLVMAYMDVFRELARESAAAIKSSKKTMHSNLPAVYEKFLLFLGGYYTAFPIQRDRHELYKIWEALSDHNDVERFRSEIEVQLSRLGDFISAEKQARRERRQKALGGIIAALSLVIAALSIPPEMLASLLDTADVAWKRAMDFYF